VLICSVPGEWPAVEADEPVRHVCDSDTVPVDFVRGGLGQDAAIEESPTDGGGSNSPAKNAEAAFKISFARRSSRFSCRSRLISSRSSAVGRSGRRPSFASTCRTYLRNVSGGSPRSAATCAIGRPESNTTRVARSNSSTGYLLALGMTDLLPPVNPAIKVSVNPGRLTD
jgi:hypothetical protein